MEVESTLMETIIAAMSDVLSLVGKTIETMVGQPLLLFFLAAGLVPVGISLFRRLKRAAKA